MDVLAVWLLERIAEGADRDCRVDRLARAMYEAWQSNNPYPFDEQAQDVRTEYLEVAEVIVDREMPGVLAECEAKRRVIKMHADDQEHYCPSEDAGSEYYNYMNGWAEEKDHLQICPTLKLLALPFAGTPGYREEWAPERQSS